MAHVDLQVRTAFQYAPEKPTHSVGYCKAKAHPFVTATGNAIIEVLLLPAKSFSRDGSRGLSARFWNGLHLGDEFHSLSCRPLHPQSSSDRAPASPIPPQRKRPAEPRTIFRCDNLRSGGRRYGLDMAAAQSGHQQ